MKEQHILILVAGLVMNALFAFLSSFIVKILWNWALVPAINGINEIGFLQAFGILLLIQFLISIPRVNFKDLNNE